MAGSFDDRYPIRETFFGCCAVASTPRPKTRVKAISETPTNFRFWILDFRLLEEEFGHQVQIIQIMILLT